MMWGLNPGPMLFQSEPEFAWGLIASLFISNAIALLIALVTIPWIIKLLKVPVAVMIPSITVICFVGAFSTSNSMFGVVVMMIGGILGYIFKKNEIPVSPLLLSFVLSSTLETNVRRTFIASQGSLELFYTRPITLVFLLIFLVIAGTPLVKAIMKKSKKQPVQEETK